MTKIRLLLLELMQISEKYSKREIEQLREYLESSRDDEVYDILSLINIVDKASESQRGGKKRTQISAKEREIEKIKDKLWKSKDEDVLHLARSINIDTSKYKRADLLGPILAELRTLSKPELENLRRRIEQAESDGSAFSDLANQIMRRK